VIISDPCPLLDSAKKKVFGIITFLFGIVISVLNEICGTLNTCHITSFEFYQKV